jgi:hypothetical protein
MLNVITNNFQSTLNKVLNPDIPILVFFLIFNTFFDFYYTCKHIFLTYKYYNAHKKNI